MYYHPFRYVLHPGHGGTDLHLAPQQSTRVLMAVSGLIGFTFFLIANYTRIFTGLNLIAGCIQIGINVFVFLSWKRGYLESKGFAKSVALIGTVVPVVMASITIIRVIVPFFSQ